MRLDERIDVLSATESTDEYGETTATYSAQATVWARVEEQMPSRTRSGSAPEEEGGVRVTVRTPTAEAQSIGSRTRLRWDGDVLRVQGRTSDPQRNGFERLSTRRVRDGA